ncbi:DoxX family protein [Agromyces albus]|uniref:DoxX family protein n=1 Tax=Agromyces albus TaxID=205332 RepID=UPI00278A3DC1|nr:DoxX family protein [Agromyces albus]MDQ0576673.1 putative membrane protein YphA (DoxX/SURF4 family) [Agromyces albus]
MTRTRFQRLLDRVTLGVRVLLSVGFAASGAMMLVEPDGLGKLVDGIGVGSWLRFATGRLQIVGAVGLVVPVLAGAAAAAWAAMMIGAVIVEIASGTPPIAATVVFVLLSWIAGRLRRRTRVLLDIVFTNLPRWTLRTRER